MDGIIQLVVFLVLLAIGVFAGRANERRHYRELAAAEDDLRDIVASSERGTGEGDTFSRGALVGGNLRSYETLLERGRREAIVRMKQQARRLGATHVVNVRLETASLSEDWSGRRPLFSAEFIAYGTALVRIS